MLTKANFQFPPETMYDYVIMNTLPVGEKLVCKNINDCNNVFYALKLGLLKLYPINEENLKRYKTRYVVDWLCNGYSKRIPGARISEIRFIKACDIKDLPGNKIVVWVLAKEVL